MVKYFGTDGENTVRAVRVLAERMAQNLAAEGKLTQTELEVMAPLFPKWSQEKEYVEGTVVRTEDGVFQLTSQAVSGKHPTGADGEGWTLLGGGV